MEKIKFPDDLTSLWRWAKWKTGTEEGGHSPIAADEQKYTEIWQKVISLLASCVKNLPGCSDKKEANDAASDFMLEMLSGPCPEHIKSKKILEQQARKFLAKKRNPVQYEMSNILRIALRTLEKEQKIKRAKDDVGKNICGQTRFALIDCERPENLIAARSDYEHNRSLRESFFVAPKKNIAKKICKKRMVAPQDALQLVLYLIKTFGAWVREEDLLWAMKFHIPEQMNFVSLDSFDEESNDTPNMLEGKDEIDYIYEMDRQHLEFVCCEMTDRIWNKICRISNKVFCLYYLPKELLGAKSVTLSSLGPSSTVGDQKDKLATIFSEERFNLELYSEEHQKRHYALMLRTMKEILKNLQGRCTENGYFSSLVNDEKDK